LSCPWDDPVGIPDFCERIRACAWVLQPASTASALAFLPAGAVIVALAGRHRQPALHLLTFASVAMAIGTVAQHATGTWAAMLLDHAGMESANVAMVLVGLRRWFGPRWSSLLIGGLLGWLAVLALTAALPDVRRALMIGGMVPCALIELRLWFRDGAATSYRWWAAGWVVFLAAVAAWGIDQQPWGCSPTSPFQLHAAWHVLSAVGIAVWSAYYLQFDALRPRGPHGP
jgi:hypothetical protein